MARAGGDTVTAAAGVAYADGADSYGVAERATREALAASGQDQADLAICFHHGRHDGAEVLSGVRAVLGAAVPVIGGTAMGVITNDQLGYEGHQIGVAVLRLPSPPTTITASGLIDRGEAAIGRDLGAQVPTDPDRDLLLFYSSIKRGLEHPEGMALNFGTPLVRGLQESAPALAGRIAGAGLIDSLQPTGSHVFAPDGIDTTGAVGLLLGPEVQMDVTVLHGCRPAGAYHRVTRTDGPVVLEIDDRPALEVIDDLLGGSVPREQYPFYVMLGVNHGERFGAFDELDYQVRLCLALDEARQGLVMFEPDLEEGSEVQLMRMSSDLSYVADSVAELRGRIGSRTPLLAIYADCAGRCTIASPLEEEEGDAVRAAIGEIPLLGFFTGVEIAPVRGEVRPLDWTGVLCLLSVA